MNEGSLLPVAYSIPWPSNSLTVLAPSAGRMTVAGRRSRMHLQARVEIGHTCLELVKLLLYDNRQQGGAKGVPH